LKIKQCSDRSI